MGTPTLVALYVVVVALMGLSLAVTATGTGRFAVAMGYDAIVGYAVGGIFDLAKACLLLAAFALWARQSLGLAAIFGVAWCILVTFSWLATHATVSTAIGAIERSGTWQMEVRANSKSELASLEQQLATLSRPALPRPAKTVREALDAERVPPSVWRDSQACKAIQEAHFAKVCAQVVLLRRELAAAQDYERLGARAAELRRHLADAPIVLTSDPLPAAFSATLGRILPLGGTEGVALLITMVVELISCTGLAGLRVLRHGVPEDLPHRPLSHANSRREGATRQSLPRASKETLPGSAHTATPDRMVGSGNKKSHCPPSNVLPIAPGSPSLISLPDSNCRREVRPGTPASEIRRWPPS